MGTLKTLIGVGVVTGVVVYVYLRSLSGKLDRSLPARSEATPQLV